MSKRCPRCKKEFLDESPDRTITHVEDRRYQYDEKEAAVLTFTDYELLECPRCHQQVILDEEKHTALKAEFVSDGLEDYRG